MLPIMTKLTYAAPPTTYVISVGAAAVIMRVASVELAHDNALTIS